MAKSAALGDLLSIGMHFQSVPPSLKKLFLVSWNSFSPHAVNLLLVLLMLLEEGLLDIRLEHQ